jgi:hypothetical protein
VLEPRLLRADKTEMGTLRDKPGLHRFLRRTPRGLLRVDKTRHRSRRRPGREGGCYAPTTARSPPMAWRLLTSSWSRSKFLDFRLPT